MNKNEDNCWSRWLDGHLIDQVSYYYKDYISQVSNSSPTWIVILSTKLK